MKVNVQAVYRSNEVSFIAVSPLELVALGKEKFCAFQKITSMDQKIQIAGPAKGQTSINGACKQRALVRDSADPVLFQQADQFGERVS
jgi:hypothetical protein